MSGHYSIFEHFTGGAVLLTGASGYVGALVLEKLLRCTDVDKIYVLLRAKKGEAVEGRLAKLLNQSPVMHLLRDHPVLSKVHPVAGDMLAAGLGISLTDLQELQRNVQTVIHCAADIRLEVGIQELLQANYKGTRQLLEIARGFHRLHAFVHVSSAYTNMNAVPGSLVHESIYRLSYGDQPVDDHELVEELLSMPAHNANLRAEGLLAQWNFPNNYTLSKHLAEYMVADYQSHFNMPVAIVRPTLISSVARDPYPGYTGNFAGHVGATLAFMAGLFDSPAASNYKASNVWDVIPADITANVILAAAAALGHGAAGSCSISPVYSVKPGGSSSSSSSSGLGNLPGLKHSTNVAEHQRLLIVHCGSSTTYPLTIMESWNWGVEAFGAWPGVPNLSWGKCAAPLRADHEPNPSRAALHIYFTGWKIWLAAKLLSWMNKEKIARKLAVGFESFKIINQPKTDVNLRFSTINMQRLAALLDPSEQDEFLLLWKPQIRRHLPAAIHSPMQDLAIKTKLDQPDTLLLAQLSVADSPVHSTSSRATQTPSPRGIGSTVVAVDSSTCSDSETVASDDDGASIGSCASARHHGAALTAEQQQAVAKMRSIPIEWRAFHINLGAFLYCNLFKMPLPPPSAVITDAQVARWLNIKPEDRVIEHHFTLYA